MIIKMQGIRTATWTLNFDRTIEALGDYPVTESKRHRKKGLAKNYFKMVHSSLPGLHSWVELYLTSKNDNLT